MLENFLTRNRKQHQRRWRDEYFLKYPHAAEFVNLFSEKVIEWLLTRDGEDSEGFYFRDYDFENDKSIDEILVMSIENEEVSGILDELLFYQLESIKSDILTSRTRSSLDVGLLDKAFFENKNRFLKEMKELFTKIVLETKEMPLDFPAKIITKIRRELIHEAGS